MSASVKLDSMKAPSKNKEESRRFGLRLRQMRQAHGWKLGDLSDRSNIALSTLSKIENGALILSYDRMIRLAQAFGLSLSEFLSDVHEPKASRLGLGHGRFSLTRSHDSRRIETENYLYEHMCTTLRTKGMTPVRATVKARTLEQFGPLSRHEGEEFMYVLSGQVIVHTEYYSPETLGPGDGLYIDSGMGHAFLSASEDLATILFVNVFVTPQTDAP
jgi:transcriptional regulator with XRE-family HTH domain